MRNRVLPLVSVTCTLLVIGASCSSTEDTADTATEGVIAEDSVVEDTVLEDTESENTVSDDTAEADEAVETDSTDDGADTSVEDPVDDLAVMADPTALFDDGALTAETETVTCTLANGSESTCYRLQTASIPSTYDTSGPFCPTTVDEVGGIWVWDGENPGLYALDADFWSMLADQGYNFVDEDGNVATNGGGGTNSCLEQTQDGSFHLEILLPASPEMLDEPTVITTISQVGLALDGITIFGDAPSVADRGGLPALDACGGHVDPSGYFHWHFGTGAIQSNLDEANTGLNCDIEQDLEALFGFAYDGHPIYGPEDNGAVPGDLDDCSGHVGATDEFGEVYHYHLTYESPNLPGCLVGAMANGALSSPDNPNASLPGAGGGAGGGGRGQRP